MSKREGSQQGSDTFTCSVDGVTACSKAPEAAILFDSRLWQSVIGLCERFNTEWMAYLIGEKRQDGDYVIKSLDFPEQVAGGAHVRREPDPNFQPPQGTVGVIHSHVAMQAFFSSVDKEHANWPVEIVVNRKGEYEVSTRMTLPCGDSMRRSSRVLLLTGGVLDGYEGKLKEALKKGEEKRAKQPVVVWSSEGHGSEYGFGPAYRGYENQDSLSQKWKNEKCPICGVQADQCPHDYRDMEAKSQALFGGKYAICPVCSSDAFTCKHTMPDMDKASDAQKGVAP